MKTKITNEQIRQHLSEGMTQVAIARRYGVAPQTLNGRIKRMRQKGLLDDGKAEGESSCGFPVQRMDTVVRRSDRVWFRVTDVNENGAVLRSLPSEDYGHQAKEIVAVSLPNLVKDFEKKAFPEVRCYTDPSLVAKSKDETIGSEPAEKKVKTPKPEPEKAEPEMEPEAEQAAEEELSKIYTVEREYLQRIDRLLSTVKVEHSSLTLENSARELAIVILKEGIHAERQADEA